jgi:predicted metal-dependent peptidase
MARQDRGKLDDTLAAMFSNVEYRTDYLFYAHMIGQCSIKIRDDLPSCAGVAFSVDHYNLYINPAKFDEFTLVERLAILKHEMLHILYGHLERKDDRVHLPWNISTDCALNQHVNPDHLPKVGVTPETLGKKINKVVPKNQSSEFYYEFLKEEMENQKQQNKNNGNGEPQEGDDLPGGSSSSQSQGMEDIAQGMDSHDTWDESVGDGDLQKDMTKKMIQKSQDETIKSKGTVPNQCSDWLEMVTRKSELDWKKVLRGITGNKRVGKRSTIMRTDRRFPHREDLRGKTRDRMFNLLVVADVSGSMGDEALLRTLSEVRHICDLTRSDVDLIQIDTQAYTPEKLSKKTKIIERKGNGGTMLSPALEMAKQHKIEYNAVVVLTDGGLWGDDISHFNKLRKKVIWLIEPSGTILEGMNSSRMQAFKLK